MTAAGKMSQADRDAIDALYADLAELRRRYEAAVQACRDAYMAVAVSSMLPPRLNARLCNILCESAYPRAPAPEVPWFARAAAGSGQPGPLD